MKRGRDQIAPEGAAPSEDMLGESNVRLRPAVFVSESGSVVNIVIGRSPRTPSPFTSYMGDHTVSWQSLLDYVRASLIGLGFEDALTRLTEMQKHADGWSTEPGSTGAKLFALLPDRARRETLLQDAAERTTTHLKKAAQVWGELVTAGLVADPMEIDATDPVLETNVLSKTVLIPKALPTTVLDKRALSAPAIMITKAPVREETEEYGPEPETVPETGPDERWGIVRQEFGLAIAHHLAYLNYLPFATVPPTTARGSKGKGEGRKRLRLVSYERAHPLPPKAETPSAPADLEEAANLRASLWGLFAFDAALRAANVRYVIDPDIGSRLEKAVNALEAIAKELGLDNVHLTVSKRNGKNRNTYSLTQPRVSLDKARAKCGAAKEYSRTLKQESETMKRVATTVRDLATTWELNQLKKNPAGFVWEAAEKVRLALLEARAELEEHRKAATDAKDRSKLVLSCLLHEHQRVVATAYPACVTDSAFLTPSPAQAAVMRLAAALKTEFELTDDDLKDGTSLGEMLKGVGERHARLKPLPQAACANIWVADATCDPLVVTFDVRTKEVVVNGRAPAPPGVAGMGSHTTAWQLEIDVLKQLVKTADNPLQTLKAAVTEELRSEVMQLDAFLPAAQLRGGQLIGLFTAAEKVMKAEQIEDAAREYLKFRNLMPFATVDAGDRGGHGERSGVELEKLYDGTALLYAASLQQDAFDKRKTATRNALEAAAKDLMSDMTRWTRSLVAHVTASRDRLTHQAELLKPGLLTEEPPVKRVRTNASGSTTVSGRIRRVRWREHRRLYEKAAYPVPSKEVADAGSAESASR
ncbi:hypothetical protein ACQEVF_48575 [Nonomuraea polychroma]|uniref:hypothetical protein n=1 Tax=Nonomuraea polychroma TaxID=46176 RepID=UPI003D8E08D1